LNVPLVQVVVGIGSYEAPPYRGKKAIVIACGLLDAFCLVCVLHGDIVDKAPP